MRSVSIPESVLFLSNDVFANCVSLILVSIPNSVEIINSRPFFNCSSLKEINVDKENRCYSSINGDLYDKNQTELISYAMGKEDALFVVPESTKSIKDGAFAGCKYLKSLEISSLKMRYVQGFNDCESLTTIKLPPLVKDIYYNAFKGCKSLKQVENIEVVTEIGWSAFEGCSSLEKIKFGKNLSRIGEWAFKNCSSLQEVVLPNSVRKIGKGAFAGCTGLKRVVISINFKNSIKEIFGDIDESIITFI